MIALACGYASHMAGAFVSKVLFMGMLLAFSAPTSAVLFQPYPLVIYHQESLSPAPNPTVRVLTNSTLGVNTVFIQNITETADPSSTVIGTQYGSASISFGGDFPTAVFVYTSMDYHLQTEKCNGTILIQGAENLLLPVRKLAVLGGTGDFQGARGYSLQSYASGSYFTDIQTIKDEIHFEI